MDTFTVNDPHMEGIATTLAGNAGDSVTIYAGSLTLDLLIALSDSTGNELELFDDDSGPGANATIDAELPSDGRYFLMVMPSTQRAYGEFSIAVTEGARAKAGRDEDDADAGWRASVQKRWCGMAAPNPVGRFTTTKPSRTRRMASLSGRDWPTAKSRRTLVATPMIQADASGDSVCQSTVTPE